MGRKSLEATNSRCNFWAREAEALARGLWLFDEAVFFELFDAVDDFFLPEVEELACVFEASVVVARAGSPRASTNKHSVRKGARKRPKELTAVQCSANFPTRNQVAALTLKIHRVRLEHFPRAVGQYLPLANVLTSESRR